MYPLPLLQVRHKIFFRPFLTVGQTVFGIKKEAIGKHGTPKRSPMPIDDLAGNIFARVKRP